MSRRKEGREDRLSSIPEEKFLASEKFTMLDYGDFPALPNSKARPAQKSAEREEIQRVRKQIEGMDTQLKEAFMKEKYEEVEEIGGKKKALEKKLREFEAIGKGEGIETSKARQMQGEIKLWFPRKHFGFIRPDSESGPDIFFHGRQVENRKDNMPIIRFARVTFSVISAPKGPQARDVSITSYQPAKEKEAEALEAATLAAKGRSATKSSKSGKKMTKSRGVVTVVYGVRQDTSRFFPCTHLAQSGGLALKTSQEREVLTTILEEPHRTKDLSGNKSIDLRSTTNSSSSSISDVLAVVNDMTKPKLKRR